MRVRLIKVDGDQEDFADLIGTEGDLSLNRTTPVYQPDGRGDWLTMVSKWTTRVNQQITIATRLGNRFTFRVLPVLDDNGDGTRGPVPDYIPPRGC